jgi:hypothetical protein
MLKVRSRQESPMGILLLGKANMPNKMTRATTPGDILRIIVDEDGNPMFARSLLEHGQHAYFIGDD